MEAVGDSIDLFLAHLRKDRKRQASPGDRFGPVQPTVTTAAGKGRLAISTSDQKAFKVGENLATTPGVPAL